jgi:hypothetical protein
MKRALAIAACLAASSTVSVTAAPPQRTLTLSGSPTTAKFGGTVTLSGKLSGSNVDGRNVRIEQDALPLDSFAQAGETTTSATGDFTLELKPTANSRFRASTGSVDSNTVDIAVRPLVTLKLSDRTPRRGQRVRFFGRVCPAHDGVRVALQRRSSAGWRTIAGPVLADVPDTTCSKYSVRRRVRRDRAFRTRFLGDVDHAAAKSRLRRARVH